MDELEKNLQELEEFATENEVYFRDRREHFWNSLSKEDQLNAFCAVVDKLFQGEVKFQKGPRHVLHTVFAFGTGANVAASFAGYYAVSRLIELGLQKSHEIAVKSTGASHDSDA